MRLRFSCLQGKSIPSWVIFHNSFSSSFETVFLYSPGWPRTWRVTKLALHLKPPSCPRQIGPGIRILPVSASETQLCGLGSNNQLKPRQWFVCFGEPCDQGDTAVTILLTCIKECIKHKAMALTGTGILCMYFSVTIYAPSFCVSALCLCLVFAFKGGNAFTPVK